MNQKYTAEFMNSIS